MQKLNDSLQKTILELEQKLEIATKMNESLSKSVNAEITKASTAMYEKTIIRTLPYRKILKFRKIKIKIISFLKISSNLV